MGTRANIHVIDNDNDPGVWLYQHWDGDFLPSILQCALAKRWRWDDSQYLTRIIFSEMIRDHVDEETGYGISSQAWDGDTRLVVNVGNQTVSNGSQKWSFEEYLNVDPEEVWYGETREEDKE